ncbi:MAG: DUF2652 domain-containing protein [Sulfitobacter sp.]
MRALEAILVVADISGYTKFVVMNKSSIIHAEQIITELMETVTKSAKFPLAVQKLEGDAVFMFAEIGSSRHDAINDVTHQVVKFMKAYQLKQKELFQKSVGGCICSACQLIEELHLKCAIHVGEVIEKNVEGKLELAGEPVILAHRLMKNSIEADGYILVTEDVAKELSFSPFPMSKSYQETITDIGLVRVEAYFSQDLGLDRDSAKQNTWRKRKLEGPRLLIGWLATRLKRGRATFHNLPE